MNDLAQQVRDLCMLPDIKRWLGGPLYTSGIERHLRQAEAFISGCLPQRQRYSVGYCVLRKERVVGYLELTVMQNSLPTACERTYIGLNGRLDYVQGKVIAVHPSYRKTDVTYELIKKLIEVSEQLEQGIMGDVIASNTCALKAFSKFHIDKLFEWKNPHGTLMCRIGRSNKKDFYKGIIL